tara:strand:+ start:343 stop:720 length:378 start_codon:yes stop_codon:yes gene_type:complete
MAFGLKEAIGAAILGTIIPGITGGKTGDTEGSESTGLIGAIKTAGGKLFGDSLMGQITGGDTSSSVASKYASVDFWDELTAANMGDALATGKAPTAVDPESNNRAMTALVTKMLSDPAYSKQIGV